MVCIATDPRIGRLKDLLEHVEHVREDCETIGIHLIERGDFDLGKQLIANGRVHDASKFAGVEWECLGSDDPASHGRAWLAHVSNNRHHPEFWGSGRGAREGIHRMPPVYVAEMVCDWHSRSSEFGSDLREWIWSEAMARFGFDQDDAVFSTIEGFLDLLLKKRFR